MNCKSLGALPVLLIPSPHPNPHLQTLFRQLALPVEEGGLGYEVSPKVKSFEHCYNTALAITSIDNKGKGFISKFNDHRHVQVGTNVTAPVDLAA